MEPPLPAVEIDESVDTVFADLSAGNRRSSSPGRESRSASSAAPTSSNTSPTAAAAATAPSAPRTRRAWHRDVSAATAARGCAARLSEAGDRPFPPRPSAWHQVVSAVDGLRRLRLWTSRRAAIHDGRARPRRVGDPTDLPDVDVRPGCGRGQQGLRLLPLREPDADGARDVPGFPGGCRPRARVLLGPRRDDDDHAPRRAGRPRRLRERRVRRRLPDVLAGVRAQGVPLHLPVLGGIRGRPRAAPDERTRIVWLETPTNPLLNVVDIRKAAEAAHAAGALVVVDNVCHALPPAAARARGRHRPPLDDEVPGRPFRRDRRLRRDQRPDRGRAPEVPAEVPRRRPRPVRLLARASRREDAGRPHGPPLRTRTRSRPSWRHPAVERVLYPGLPAIRATRSPRVRCATSAG